MNSLLNNPIFAATAPSAAIREKPMGFIDVGARWGTHEVVEPIAGATAVLAFEPDEEEFTRIRDRRLKSSPWACFEIEPMALYDKQGTAELRICTAPNNSSLRDPNPRIVERYAMAGFDEVRRVTVPTETLDNVIFGLRGDDDFWGEFVKLDTQGAEYEILQGAKRCLDERTVAVIAETAFLEQYSGQKLFSEIELFMRQRGFTFYGFLSLHLRSCKQLDKVRHMGKERAFFIDALFLKDPLDGGGHSRPLTERGNYILFISALLLEYYDFALELALTTWAKGEEADRIKALVDELASVAPGRTAKELMEVADRIKANPDFANVEVGRFVDKRRYNFNYDDVAIPGISPDRK